MKNIIVFLGNSLFLLSLCISFIGCDDGELYSKELVAFIELVQFYIRFKPILLCGFLYFCHIGNMMALYR